MGAGSGVLVFEADVDAFGKPGSAPSVPAHERGSADRLIQAVAADPAIAFASPVFYTEQGGVPQVLTDEVVVKLRTGAEVHQLGGVVRSARVLRRLGGTTDQYVLEIGAPRWTLALDVADELSRSPIVEWAEPNFLVFVRQHVIPNDPLFANQWNLNNTGQTNARVDADVDAPEAWNTTTGSTKVIVAVLDDGVETNHPDLNSNLAINTGEIAGNGIDDDGNGYVDDVNGWDFSPQNYPPGDNDPNPSLADDNHGTAVTGVAVAVGNNAAGGAGSGYGCRLLPIRVDHGGLLDIAGMAEAIYYAAGRTRNGLGTWRGADILNISSTFAQFAVIDAAFDWAESNARGGKGVPVFCAAGNSASGYAILPYTLTGIYPSTWYFEWRYSTDGSILQGDNTVWVAYVELPDGTVQRFDAAGVPAGWNMAVPGDPSILIAPTGAAASDLFGFSVAGAGDVNGDGFADLIVGAFANDAGGANAGRAYVYYGGPAGDATADLTLTGAAAGDEIGVSVAGAGDVNGDGFADLIVGALGNNAGGPIAGRAYVYYGGPAADAVADLTLTRAAAGDNFGQSVAGAGDVNGDGFADLIVGANNDAGGGNAGRAYVYYGGPAADAIADLTLTGAAAFDNFGVSVAGTGDVNGDGFADLIVGAPYNDAGGADAGRAYVYSVSPWTIRDDPAHAYGVGRYVARAGAIGHNAVTTMRTRNVVVAAAGQLRYRAWVSSEANFDKLELYARDVTAGITYGPFLPVSGVPATTTGPGYPASYSENVAVGAGTDWDYRSDYSQYGPRLDFVAPSNGGFAGVTTTDRQGAAGYGSTSYTSTFGGTSSASPLAAGVAALVLSANPNLTASQVRQSLRNTCDQIGPASYMAGRNDYYGHGRINANAALAATLVGVGDSPESPRFVNALSQNRPNPFNPETIMPYSTAASGRVVIRVFDIAGRMVKTLVDRVEPAGIHFVRWNGKTDGGERVASGVYFYRITYSDGSVSAKKLAILR